MARVLVIEDNPANLELMTYLLESFGHAVAAATDGESGLRRALDEAFDLIVCDVQLPQRDGCDVVREIRSCGELASLPVVAVTALAMVGDRERLLASGYDGYISKPIDPARFVPSLERFLDAGRGDVRAMRRVCKEHG